MARNTTLLFACLLLLVATVLAGRRVVIENKNAITVQTPAQVTGNLWQWAVSATQASPSNCAIAQSDPISSNSTLIITHVNLIYIIDSPNELRTGNIFGSFNNVNLQYTIVPTSVLNGTLFASFLLFLQFL